MRGIHTCPGNRRVNHPNSRRRVILVEDDEDTRRALTVALKEDGYDVVAARNGLEALDHLRWRPSSACVVLDMRLPVMTGWEFRDILESDPRFRDVALIGITGGRWKPGDSRGFVALLSKPIDPRDLLEAVHRWGGEGPEA